GFDLYFDLDLHLHAASRSLIAGEATRPKWELEGVRGDRSPRRGAPTVERGRHRAPLERRSRVLVAAQPDLVSGRWLDTRWFHFRLELCYTLTADALSLEASVENRSTREALPYAFGVHPGFAFPFAGGDPSAHRIVFDEEERAAVPIIAPGGLFSSDMRAIPL